MIPHGPSTCTGSMPQLGFRAQLISVAKVCQNPKGRVISAGPCGPRGMVQHTGCKAINEKRDPPIYRLMVRCLNHGTLKRSEYISTIVSGPSNPVVYGAYWVLAIWYLIGPVACGSGVDGPYWNQGKPGR